MSSKPFNPELFQIYSRKSGGKHFADSRDGCLYLYHDERIVMAVNVAMVTNRPLLLRGPSGCGKSSLAYNVARVLNARYYEFVVNSRSKAQDLLWRFDAVRRLSDATVGALSRVSDENNMFSNTSNVDFKIDYHPYVEPGILWWVFNRDSAKYRGMEKECPSHLIAKDPFENLNVNANDSFNEVNTVLLVDEIDKAEPEFSNDLLVPFGSYQFYIEEIKTRVALKKPKGMKNAWEGVPLLIITTNDERQLSDAFLRRCLVLDMAMPVDSDLIKIAKETIEDGKWSDDQYTDLLEKIKKKGYDNFSIPEFIDLARACQHLEQFEVGFLDRILETVLFRDRE